MEMHLWKARFKYRADTIETHVVSRESSIASLISVLAGRPDIKPDQIDLIYAEYLGKATVDRTVLSGEFCSGT